MRATLLASASMSTLAASADGAGSDVSAAFVTKVAAARSRLALRARGEDLDRGAAVGSTGVLSGIAFTVAVSGPWFGHNNGLIRSTVSRGEPPAIHGELARARQCRRGAFPFVNHAMREACG